MSVTIPDEVLEAAHMDVVSDASPIIGLAAVGHLDLVRMEFGQAVQVVLPPWALDDLLSQAGFRISTLLRSRVLEVAGESE